MLMVLYPAGVIVVNSFQIDRESTLSLAGWKIAFSDPVMISAIWNTLTITLARQAIALPIAILLAWIIARTDIPGASSLEFLFWLGIFLPPLPVTMGWIVLLDPEYGLANKWVALLPFIKEAPFNIYSFLGQSFGPISQLPHRRGSHAFYPRVSKYGRHPRGSFIGFWSRIDGHFKENRRAHHDSDCGGCCASGHRPFPASVRVGVDLRISFSVLCV